jgi:hypothetical protein
MLESASPSITRRNDAVQADQIGTEGATEHSLAWRQGRLENGGL